MFRRSMAENLPAVAERLPDGTTFVLTGDIPAMWLRDSAAQLRPYLLLCKDDPGLQEVLIGVLHRQLEYVVLDPYANAFNREANGAGHTNDETEMSPWVWERKYEIDSLCFPLELAYRLWRITGRADVIDERFRAAADGDHRAVDRGAGSRGAGRRTGSSGTSRTCCRRTRWSGRGVAG